MAEQPQKSSEKLKVSASKKPLSSQSSLQPPKGSCRVFVGTRGGCSFPEWLTECHLDNHFASFSSDILRVTIARGTRNSRFGIVTFTSRAVAEEAIQKFDGSMLKTLCLYLNFFGEKKTGRQVTPSAALKKPLQQVKPAQGKVARTETKGTTSSSASIPVKGDALPSSKKPHVHEPRSNSGSRRSRRSRSESTSSAPDEGSSPKGHACDTPQESPLSPLVPPVPESSSQLSLSAACSPTPLEVASSEPLSPACSDPVILIKYLSRLVTEEEIKLLLLRYSFKMVSCKLNTATEVSESDPDKGTALVHLDKCCNVSEVVKTLNGLTILGECISVVPFQASDCTPATRSPTLQASLSSVAQVGSGSEVATQRESCSKVDDLVDDHKTSSTQEKSNSPSSDMPLSSTTPVVLRAKQVLCMSEYRYSFFMKQFPEDAKHFQEGGGKVSYLKGQMVAQAPTKDILGKFINDISKTGEVKQYLSPDQWRYVQAVSSGGDKQQSALIAVLDSDLRAEVHLSLNEPQVLLVVGVTDDLVKAGNQLNDFLKRDIPQMCLDIKAFQMKVLFSTLPNLTEYIFQQYGVKVDGFNVRSTYLVFRGPPAMIAQAREDVNAKVSSVLLKQVEFPHPHNLIRSAQKRINEFDAFLLLPDGEENTSAAVQLRVQICSLVEDSLEAACQVVKNGLIENRVTLASASPTITNVCTELQKEVEVVITVQESSQNSTSLLIQGYVLDDIKMASKKLDETFNLMTRSLRLQNYHRAYLKELLCSTPPQGEGERLNHSLCDLAVRVEFNDEAGVCLIGVGQAIESVIDQILGVLHGLNHQEFPYTCDLCFLELIKQKVLNPIQTEKKAVFYSVEKKPKHEATAGAVTFSISIFSKDPESFKHTCEAMKAVCPYSSSHSIHPDALSLKRKSLNKVASKHSAKIELVIEPEPLLRIHTLQRGNAVSCWAEMSKFIASAIKTTEVVKVNVYKAKYIQSKHAEEIAEFGQQCDIRLPQLDHKAHSSTSLSIRIKGNIGIVNKACKRIKEVSEQCEVKQVTLKCPFKCLSMWRKRWEEFQEEQEEQYDILMDLNCRPPSLPCRRGSDQPQSDYDTPVASTFVIYGHDREGIETTVQLLREKENGKLHAESVFELSEREQIILLTGLKKKELNPRTKFSICMDIDKETRSVKLTAPLSWESRLLDAKEEILQFIGDQTRMKYEFICDDRVVGLVLTSRSFEFCSQSQKIAQDSNISSIQPFRKPHPGFRLWGVEASIEQFKSRAESLISSHIRPIISSIQLELSTLELSALSSDEFRHLESRLEEELCVVCQCPSKGIGKDEACGLSDESDQEEASPLAEGKRKHWFWEDDNGQFMPYPSEVSDSLTALHSQCSTRNFDWVCPENGNQYCIDLTRLEQRNTVTGVARKVRLQPAKCYWTYIDVYGVNHHYDDTLSDQLENGFSHGIKEYVSGTLSFDLELMVMKVINKPIEIPMIREIKAAPLDKPQDKKEKKPKDRAHTKIASLVIRGPKKNLRKAQSQIGRKLGEIIITKHLDLPPHSSIDFEKNLRKIAKDRSGIFVSIVAKHEGVAGPTQAKVIEIKGLRKSVDAVVIKIQDEIIKFHSCKLHSVRASETQDTPAEWEAQDQTVELFPVQHDSDEWCQVTGPFRKTLPTVRILSVKRIQNRWLWDKYVHHRAMLHQKNDGKINEMKLFHGTRGTDPRKIFDSEEGFDMRYSSAGLWGQANYFAVNASYSDVYAHTERNGDKEIFLAKVLTGSSVQCEQDRSLRMPPLMSTATGGIGVQQQRYDTVHGTTQDSVVYMTYSNEKAYPAYLIRYHDNDDFGFSGAQQASHHYPYSALLHQHSGSSQPHRSSSHTNSSAYSPHPHPPPSLSTITANGSSVSTVTGNGSSVSTITANGSSVSTVTGNGSSVSTITANGSSVSTVTGNGSSVSTITGNGSSVSTVTGNGSSVSTITANGSSVSTITAIGSPVAIVKGNISFWAVQSVPGDWRSSAVFITDK